MSDALWGFAVASFCIGGLMGGLNGDFLQTKFGRKKTITFNSLGYIMGVIFISCATSTAMFIVGRIICGYSCGLGSLSIPVYIGEISTIRARGTTGTFNQGMLVTGILLSNIIGLPLSSVPFWRLNHAIVAIPAIFQLITMQLCVESPRYLISIGRIEEARLNLRKLRPNSNIEMEFYGMIEGQLGTEAAMATSYTTTKDYNNHQQQEQQRQSLDKINVEDFATTLVVQTTTTTRYSNNKEEKLRGGDPMNMIEVFQDSIIHCIAFILILLHALQQLIGINAVMYYSTTIFDIVFNSSDMSKYMAITTSIVNFIATAISILCINRISRRTLLLISVTGACIFSILLVIGYVYNVGILLALSVLACVFFLQLV